jgi:hypothetical protein
MLIFIHKKAQLFSVIPAFPTYMAPFSRHSLMVAGMRTFAFIIKVKSFDRFPTITLIAFTRRILMSLLICFNWLHFSAITGWSVPSLGRFTTSHRPPDVGHPERIKLSYIHIFQTR